MTPEGSCVHYWGVCYIQTDKNGQKVIQNLSHLKLLTSQDERLDSLNVEVSHQKQKIRASQDKKKSNFIEPRNTRFGVSAQEGFHKVLYLYNMMLLRMAGLR